MRLVSRRLVRTRTQDPARARSGAPERALHRHRRRDGVAEIDGAPNSGWADRRGIRRRAMRSTGYGPGRSFMALAGQVMASVDISRLAAPVVDRLVAEVDCTVHVGALSGDEMVYVIRTDSSKPYRMRSRVGLAIPLHPTGMGKAVMASWDDEPVARLRQADGAARPHSRDGHLAGQTLRGARRRRDGRICARPRRERTRHRLRLGADLRQHRQATHGLSISRSSGGAPGPDDRAVRAEGVAAADEISRLLGAKR